MKRKCILCKMRPAAVPDRERMGRQVARVCRECHAARLRGDLVGIIRHELKLAAPEEPKDSPMIPPQTPQALIALKDQIRARAREHRQFAGVPCQSESSWHADELDGWADTLEAALALVTRPQEAGYEQAARLCEAHAAAYFGNGGRDDGEGHACQRLAEAIREAALVPRPVSSDSQKVLDRVRDLPLLLIRECRDRIGELVTTLDVSGTDPVQTEAVDYVWRHVPQMLDILDALRDESLESQRGRADSKRRR